MLNSQIGYGKTQTSEKKQKPNCTNALHIRSDQQKKKKKLDDTKA